MNGDLNGFERVGTNMKISEWISAWENKIPLFLQEEWDNCGLQVGKASNECTGIVFALDLFDDVIDECEKLNANLIVTHHPAIFTSIKSVTDDTYTGNMILKCIEKGISVYSSHTNLDWVNGGVNDVIANLLKLSDISALRKFEDDERLKYSIGEGRVGIIEKSTLLEFVKYIKSVLDASNIIFYGDENKEIQKIAVLGGSGMEFAEEALTLGADVFVTADIKYHDACSYVEKGLALIDVGHYWSEFPVMRAVFDLSEEIAPELNRRIIQNRFYRLRKVVI